MLTVASNLRTKGIVTANVRFISASEVYIGAVVEEDDSKGARVLIL